MSHPDSSQDSKVDSKNAFADGRKSRVAKLTLNLFRPLARLWLRHGFTTYEVQELLRWSMTRVAMTDAEFAVPDRKVHRQTMARAAVLTGLPRREVQRLAESQYPDIASLEQKYHRVSRLLSGWLKDPEFLDEKGKPRKLPLRSATASSFADLAYRYCRDVPARAMADELVLRGNAVHLAGRKLALVDPVANVVRGTGEEIAVLDEIGGALMDALCEAMEGRPVRHFLAQGIPESRMRDLEMEMQALIGNFETRALDLLRRYEGPPGVREGGVAPYGVVTVPVGGRRESALN